LGLVSRSRALEARRARALKKGSYLALAPCQRGLKIERIATSSQAMMIVLELDTNTRRNLTDRPSAETGAPTSRRR